MIRYLKYASIALALLGFAGCELERAKANVAVSSDVSVEAEETASPVLPEPASSMNLPMGVIEKVDVALGPSAPILPDRDLPLTPPAADVEPAAVAEPSVAAAPVAVAEPAVIEWGITRVQPDLPPSEIFHGLDVAKGESDTLAPEKWFLPQVTP